ncbi:hypothetical protein PF005_g20377 [Phytophthora fragariae]|uniref:Uncharacterized protein n=1 Tax=Phytophthora fragariae TaxID=53985 RepID=A0A6A3RAJ1_9STRA|nr:hypothetical protein PF003_g7672 [Phytophthora fragariae]KAE8928472.1 hypothetical protein PF009_g21385 [Phytophthora fragariae]KAE8988626.1 hypothetical protein PF011_g19091 [Phytophthora fragariae]KAE9087441.1 hypothetical protein PF010_g19724 [Phytophthora fragariae]KAE9090293.1 hypothetical protein PF007_g19288 [Phytophthora fragariae]
MPSPPSRCLNDRQPLDPKQQQQQYQNPADDQRDVEATAARAKATAAAFAMRKQWEAKTASFQRGLEHVQHCHAGDACGSSLCHSTRRLMKTYATHPCPKKSGNNNNNSSADCRVCKLWDFLGASQQPHQLPRLQRALAQHGGLSCGSTLLQTRRLTRPSVLHRRIATAQKEAQTMMRRF